MSKANRVISGTFSALWINGEKLADLESFEANVTLEYEDVYFPEETGKYRKFMGWTGEGTLTVKKVFSRGANLLGEAVTSGQLPDITMTSRLGDPDAYGVERTSFGGVTFNSFQLANLQQRTLLTEELGFEFASFGLLETIQAQENITA